MLWLLIGAVPGAFCPVDWLPELELEGWLPEGWLPEGWLLGFEGCCCMGAVPGAGLLWAGAGLWASAVAPARSATRARVAKCPAERRGEETGVKFVKSIFLAWGACARGIILKCAPKRCVVFKDIPAEAQAVFGKG